MTRAARYEARVALIGAINLRERHLDDLHAARGKVMRIRGEYQRLEKQARISFAESDIKAAERSFSEFLIAQGEWSELEQRTRLLDESVDEAARALADLTVN